MPARQTSGTPLRVFLGLPILFQGRGIIEQPRGGPKMKFLIGFVVSMYLLGAAVFGVNYYFGHPEQSLFDAVARGLAWPGVLVEMARSPSL